MARGASILAAVMRTAFRRLIAIGMRHPQRIAADIRFSLIRSSEMFQLTTRKSASVCSFLF
jgi:hypothetical protein